MVYFNRTRFFANHNFCRLNLYNGPRPANCPPDKELCARMLRFGNEAYARGKYLDAKEYFRKAVKADPTSLKAWRYYDQAVIFGLAEKVEKNANLILPDVSTRTGSWQRFIPGSAAGVHHLRNRLSNKRKKLDLKLLMMKVVSLDVSRVGYFLLVFVKYTVWSV